MGQAYTRGQWRAKKVDDKTMVGKTIEAVSDGAILHLKEPLDLKKGTRVRIVIEAVEAVEVGEEKLLSFLQTAKNLRLQGPPDWSTNTQHYLYSEDIAP
jgi:predicted DNA-binding antitoxin AbrB/MazE fold protein